MNNGFLPTVTDVFSLLKTVVDPELNVDIVSLGLIYDVQVVADSSVPRVRIKMTLTTPGCPLVGVINQMIKESLLQLPGVDDLNQIEIELTFDPPWTPDMMNQEAKIKLGFE